MHEFVDKRKNFRFPAFKDGQGVKLPEESTRVLFEDDFASPFSENVAEPLVQESPTETFYQEMPKNEPISLSEPYVPPKPKPLKRAHRQDLSYQGPPMEETVVEVKKPVFYSDHRASLETKLTSEKKIDTRESSNAQPGKYKGRSYFVPKHIPASIVPVEVTPNYNKQDIVQRMKKPKASYLVLEQEEERAFRYDEIEKKQISAFEIQEKENEIPFTRREFKKLKKEAKPKSVADDNTPAFTKKKAEQQEAASKASRLEKSLSGIIEEETAHQRGNKYFD